MGGVARRPSRRPRIALLGAGNRGADVYGEGVSSVGELTHFRAENAPRGSADRCTGACEVERLELDARGRHGGGDGALLLDVLERLSRRVSGHPVDPPVAALAEAVESHVMAFAAERSRTQGMGARLDELA